jgi:hypothetical protein
MLMMNQVGLLNQEVSIRLLPVPKKTFQPNQGKERTMLRWQFQMNL